jgi:hypothetical protein
MVLYWLTPKLGDDRTVIEDLMASIVYLMVKK